MIRKRIFITFLILIPKIAFTQITNNPNSIAGTIQLFHGQNQFPVLLSVPF